MRNLKFPRIRDDIRQLIGIGTEKAEIEPSEEEMEVMTEKSVNQVEEQVPNMAEQQGQDNYMNKSFGTLISDPDVQPFEEVDATLGEIQEDIEVLEDCLETLGDELEMQKRKYERITNPPEGESIPARKLRAQKANRVRLMYTAKLEAFKDIHDNLECKVRLLSKMIREEVEHQTNQNYKVQEHLDQIEAALGARERASINKSRDLGQIDGLLNAMQYTGDMSVKKDMQVIKKKAGKATQRQSEFSYLAEEVLTENHNEQADNNPKKETG